MADEHFRSHGDVCKAASRRVVGDPSRDDRMLADSLAAAFDRMGPNAEAEERMLANLLVVAEKRAAGREDGDRLEPRAFQPVPASRRKRLAALSIAACLVLAAGAGLLAIGLTQEGQMQMLGSGMSSAPAGGGDAQAEPNGTLGVPSPGQDAEAGGVEGSDESAASPYDGDAAEGPVDASGGARSESGDADARYPHIALASGERLRVALGDGGPLEADASAVGNEIGAATAFDDAEVSSVGCTVFASAVDAHSFVVRFDGDGRYYFADAVEG